MRSGHGGRFTRDTLCVSAYKENTVRVRDTGADSRGTHAKKTRGGETNDGAGKATANGDAGGHGHG